MTSFRYFFLKNKELILYILFFLSHGIFAPFYRKFGFESLFLYNTFITFTYGIFILLFSNSHKRVFINFAYCEVLFYSVMLTVTTGADFGTRYFSICAIPSLFFFVYSSNQSLKYHLIFSTLAALATFFIIWFEFIRPRAIFLGFFPAVTVYKSFYIIHVAVSAVIALFDIIYLSMVTELSLIRETKKTKKHAEELDYMANHDQLTGLLNRRKISTYFKACEYKKLTENKDYAICIFDIDNFKSVNDIYGHDAGDFILVRITSLVSTMLPPDATIARWGGEEFLIVFNNYGIDIIDRLNEIRKTVGSSNNLWKDTDIKITLTFGLSSSKSGMNSDKIIIDADNRLFFGKQNGKNRVCVSEVF